MFIFFRCTTFIGVCVEFVAAITWLAEVFEDKKQKERWLGITQAFASLGGVCVTMASAWLLSHAATLPTFSLPAGLGGALRWAGVLFGIVVFAETALNPASAHGDFAGMILPALLRIKPGLTPLAAAGLAIITLGATVITLKGGAINMAIFPFVVCLLSIFVAYGRWRVAPIAPR